MHFTGQVWRPPFEANSALLQVTSNNLQSEKIMKKTEMVKEGELRKIRFKNGNWDNELRYSILVEEWKQK